MEGQGGTGTIDHGVAQHLGVGSRKACYILDYMRLVILSEEMLPNTQSFRCFDFSCQVYGTH